MLGQVELFRSLVACFKIFLLEETSSNSTNNSRGLEEPNLRLPS